jgi:hypothetical protein
MVYDNADGFPSTLRERAQSYGAIVHPCSAATLGRNPLAFPRAYLTQHLVSPLSRHDHHDGFTGEVHGRSLVLFGKCVRCEGQVARVLEGVPVSEALQPGDRVIWWKRIPGGDYVYPVQAAVLSLTAKRVKIEADDDGDLVVRYVPRESLQRQG